jgi:hypothetical protein
MLRITRETYLKGLNVKDPIGEDLEINVAVLLYRVNALLEAAEKDLGKRTWVCNSGYRPPAYNAAIKGSPNSAHITCQAVDIGDRDRSLMKWIMANPTYLEIAKLYMEDPAVTTTWIHLQTRPTKSGNRIFKP